MERKTEDNEIEWRTRPTIGAQPIQPTLRRLRGQGEYELMNEFQPLIAGETRTSTGRLPSVELPPSSVASLPLAILDLVRPQLQPNFDYYTTLW